MPQTERHEEALKKLEAIYMKCNSCDSCLDCDVKDDTCLVDCITETIEEMDESQYDDE